MEIRAVSQADAALRAMLCDLLLDCVNSGSSSVGFLAPLSHETALAYWDGVFGSLGDSHALWVARDDESVVGAVQLALSPKENGRHRAEVQKLFVLTPYRRRGIASRLMEALEAFARAHGRTLLVLDTEAGSAAESFYRRHGWFRVGEIPDYAVNPAGVLHPTALYYKRLVSEPDAPG